MQRFIGRFSEAGFSFFTEASKTEITESKHLTVIADGYITNSDLIAAPNQKANPLSFNIAQQLSKAYLRWGVDLNRHVLGQFVAAIIDHDNCQVTLVQDSLGIYQMFYSTIAGEFSFSNRLDDLAIMHSDVGLDMEYFADLLAKAVVCTEHTPYNGIHRLRFGMTLVWKAGCCELSRAWSPADVQVPLVKSDSEYEDMLMERLFGAVEPLVASNETVWSHLSGGLDSTSVLMTALKLGKQVEALTFIDPAGADFGDTIVSRSVIDTLDIPWHTIDVRCSLPFSDFPTNFRGEPGAETHFSRQTAYHNLLSQHGVDAVLTGIGGDVTFGSPDCPPHYLADDLYNFDIVSLYRSLTECRNQDSQRRSLMHWFVNSAARPAFRHLLRKKIGKSGALRALPSWLDHHFVQTYDLRGRDRVQETPRHPDPGRHALWEELYLQAADLTSANSVYTKVKFCHPLLDRRLLELMFSIPFDQRQRPLQDRYLQRIALRDLLPKIVVNRRNKGSGQRPYDEGLRSAHKWLIMLSNDPLIVQLGLVDRHHWCHEVDRASFGLYESLPHFAMAACIECWLQQREQGLPDSKFELLDWSKGVGDSDLPPNVVPFRS